MKNGSNGNGELKKRSTGVVAAIPASQTPDDTGDVQLGHRSTAAAGIPAVLQTMRFTLREMGAVRGVRQLLKLNQKKGFDCQSCAWPSPDEDRHFAEFCENGVKAVADEATTRRITREFFAQHSVADLAAQSDHWLNHQGRLTEPMVLRQGGTHYEPITWPAAFALLAKELHALASPNEASFYTSGRTVVPYSIPRKCAAVYFPEGNAFVPIGAVATKSGTPVSKFVPITIAPSATAAAGQARIRDEALAAAHS